MHAEHAIGRFDIEHLTRVPGDGNRYAFRILSDARNQDEN